MRRILWTALALSAFTANAEAAVRFLPGTAALPTEAHGALEQAIEAGVDTAAYREVRAQIVGDHVLLYLHSRTHHRVDFASLSLGHDFAPGAVTAPYALHDDDRAQLRTLHGAPRCPDPTVEFISFAPNDDDFEVGIAKEVAAAAKAKNLKTVELYVADATSQAYLDYMSCPKLRGNFYDGDADPTLITTYDGEISSDEIDAALRRSFRHKVTNIWLACQAYNNPIRDVVRDGAESRKYAAGINDLLVGPSDRAAACAMEAGLDGKPLTSSFKECYDRLDTTEDKWGFGGGGSDRFWD